LRRLRRMEEAESERAAAVGTLRGTGEEVRVSGWGI
jgi:hypothetical protein